MGDTKTNNSYLQEKINLRLHNLPNKKNIKVLECYGGEGLIWNEIRKTRPDIKVLRIERNQTSQVVLSGDNVKWMKSLKLNQFDIIDLDAYWVPFVQLEILFQQKFKGIVFVTFIQTMMGQLPHGFLHALGYTKAMIKKCPTLFSKNGWLKMKHYLSTKGVKRLKFIRIGNKNYFCFNLHN